MSKQNGTLSKAALVYIYDYFERNGKDFLFHNYTYVLQVVDAFKEIAKEEGFKKDKIQVALLVVAFRDVGLLNDPRPLLDNHTIVEDFLKKIEMTPEQTEEFTNLMNFAHSETIPRNKLEQVLRDSTDINLASPDTLEKMNLLRMERKILFDKVYDDIAWLEICKNFYVTHNYYTSYAKAKYGTQRTKNFHEIDQMLYKMKIDQQKQLKTANLEAIDLPLTFKETEDLFKVAFRNYVDLISVADQKAGLMIQVNSIIVSVVIAFAIRHIETHALLVVPLSILLVVSLSTIYFAILASKPQEEVQRKTGLYNNEAFFFGSFDRIDNEFIITTWEEFKSSMQNITKSKIKVLLQITKETFTVRKVLAQKFKYISLAYKVFKFGLIITMIAFLGVYLVSI